MSTIKFLVPLLVLTVGSALVAAGDHYGDVIEKTTTFFSTLVSYLAIVLLATKFKGVSLLSTKAEKLTAVALVVLTLVDGLYPAFIYRDQQLPSDYWAIFSVQLIFNIFIAKVITSDQSRN